MPLSCLYLPIGERRGRWWDKTRRRNGKNLELGKTQNAEHTHLATAGLVGRRSRLAIQSCLKADKGDSYGKLRVEITFRTTARLFAVVSLVFTNPVMLVSPSGWPARLHKSVPSSL